MINILRTRLLNLSASPDSVNEEFIESSFVPATLTSNQAALRNLVFPGTFDRAYQNFIATLLVRLVADSPFAVDIWDLDPRVLMSNPALYGSQFNPSILVHRTSNADSLDVSGELVPDVRAGVFSRSWQITRVSGSSVSILDYKTGVPTTQTVTFNQGTSLRFNLNADGSLYARLSNVSSVPSGLNALVTASVPMSYSIIELADRLRLSAGTRALLFDIKDTTLLGKCIEHFDSDSRPDFTIAAALTAYAYSLEQQ